MSDAPVAGKLRFDPVITWGHILMVIAIVGSAFSIYTLNEVRATAMDARITQLETMSKDFGTQAGASLTS